MFGPDQLAATKREHLDLSCGEVGSVEDVVRRWLMIALTRSVHASIVTIADAESPIVTVCEPSARLPAGILESTTIDAWDVLAPV